MRIMVDCVYDNFVDIVNIVDNLNSYYPNKVLSAKQGAILNDRISIIEDGIVELDNKKANSTDVYTKVESDTRYYTQDYINMNYYTNQEMYNKAEVDDLIATLQNLFIQLDERIDNIVAKNNLEE
jgi:hypothetical protein